MKAHSNMCWLEYALLLAYKHKKEGYDKRAKICARIRKLRQYERYLIATSNKRNNQ